MNTWFSYLTVTYQYSQQGQSYDTLQTITLGRSKSWTQIATKSFNPTDPFYVSIIQNIRFNDLLKS